MNLFRNTRSLIAGLLVLLIPAAALIGAVYFAKTEHSGGAQGGRVPASTVAASTLVSNQDDSAGSALNVPAPDFELPDHTGRRVRLRDFRGKCIVVLAFYVYANTPG